MLQRPRLPIPPKTLRARFLVAAVILLYLLLSGVTALATGERVIFLADELPWWEYGLVTGAVVVLNVIFLRRWRAAVRAEAAYERNEESSAPPD
jgi:membrane protein implicated in regulation of membrane protease activity